MRTTRTVSLAVAILGASLATQLHAAVGRTAGTAVVNATGAAEYSIPLWVPPGTNGLQPALSLDYSSRGDTGHFGVGWRLNGLSAIARCQRTWAQDGLARDVRNDANDRFCLDGNQLRLVGGATYGGDGAEYRTELENFSRIRSYGSAGNGPAYFRLEQKNGLIYEYGNTADSQILSLGQTTARLWAVNKISDRAGNAMLFSYAEDAGDGSFRIRRIQYTQNSAAGINPPYEVRFNYEPLPANEIDLKYMAHSAIRRTVRAQKIEILHDTNIIRQYWLRYEPLSTTSRSRLASFQECPSQLTDCLPVTTFSYQDATAGLHVETNSGTAVPVNTIAPLGLDVNGDGRDDLVYSSTATSGTGHWMVAIANGAGYSAAINTGVVNNNYIGGLPFDYNGDGLDDLLVPHSGGTWWVMLGTSSGLAAPFDTGVPTTETGVGGNARAIDINGDGWQDLVWVDLFGWSGGDAIRYRLRQPGGTFSATVVDLVGPLPPESMILNATFGIEGRNGSRVPDFNGDGGGDVVFRHAQREWDDETRTYTYQYYIAAHCPNSFSFSAATSASSASGYPYFGDFNGDGKSDLLHRNASSYYLRLSTGKSFHTATLTNLDAYGPDWVILDWDTDGFDDVLLPHTASGEWHWMRSKAESLAPPVSTGIPWSGTANAIVMDLNGDGLTDLGYHVGGAWKYRVHAGVPGDLLLSATDGLGNSATFSYASLSSYGLYTRQASAVFPIQDYQGPMHVVSQLSQSDGIGGSYQLQSFSYEGAKMHLQGRGFLGFAHRSWVDARDNTVQRRSYRQDFPYIGMLVTERRTQASGTSITEAATTHAAHQYGSGFERRWLTYPRTVTRSDREVGGASNGQQIRTTVQDNLVDANTGTLYDRTTTTTEATSANGVQPGSSYIERVYQPIAELEMDWTQWCFGVPGRIEVTNSHSQYGGTAITRSDDITWDTSKCRITHQVTQPGSLQVTRTLGYDDFGNVNSVTMQGAGMPARVTTSSWGTDGRFLRRVTNALSQATEMTWNTDFGVLESLTDPNLIVTSWQYDPYLRRTSENRPDGTATTWTYEDCSISTCVGSNNTMRVTETVLASNGNIVTERHSYLDSFERVIATSERMFSGAHSRIDREFDQFGRLARESAPCWWTACSQFWTSYQYDLLDRITQLSRPVSDSDSSLQASYHHYEGLTTRSIDALGKQSTRIVNVLGALARSTDHDGYSQNFDYDSFKNLVLVTDSLGNTLLTNTFSDRGMLTAQVDIAAGALSYIPNALGEVVQQTDAKGQVTIFGYDALGRLTTRQEAEGTSVFTFGTSASAHNIGKLASMSGPGYSEGFAYDAAGRLQQRTITSDANYAFNYTYNAAGLLDTLTYPTSTSGYRFTLQHEYQNGRLWRVRNLSSPSTVYWTANDTDARGNVINETRGNGVQTISGYDAVSGRLDYLQSGSAGSVQNLSYGWDRVGNLTSRQDMRQGLTETFTYDNLHRVLTSTGPDPMTIGYDARGNILSRTGSVSSDNGHTVTWYSYNLPNTITAGAGGSSSQFFYGPDRARWKQIASYGTTSEQTVYVGNGLLEKVTLGTVTSWRHYIVGGSGPAAVYTRKSNGTEELHYLNTDHLGSIDTVSNISGTVEVRLSFGSFGQRRNASGWTGNPTASDWTEITDSTRRGFTDHEMLDNLNLTHMNGRVYDPLVGRFLSPDPFIQAPELTQSYNRYSYVLNRPLSHIDPSGLTSTNDLAGCAFPPCFMPREPPEFGDPFVEGSRDPRRGGYNGGDERGIPPNWRADSPGCDMVGCRNDVSTVGGVRDYISNVHTSLEGAFFGLVPRSVFEFADPFSPVVDAVEATSEGEYGGAVLAVGAALFKPTKAAGRIWSGASPVRNAFEHWKKHRGEFPELQNAKQYVEATRRFFANPPAGTQTFTRPNGDRLFYDAASNTFGVQRADGVPRTMFRPNDGYEYWLKAIGQ